MNSRILSILLSLSLFTVPAAASQDTYRKIDALFTEWTNPAAPGLAVGVIQNGEFIYKKGFGSANIENGAAITPKSVFYLASVGKQFTTFAIALLQQDGKLDVDDDIRKYIPEIPDYGSTITIRHLIHHSSGIRDYLGLMRIAGLKLGTYHDDQDVVDLIARQKALNFEPGEEYLYSNSGYFLLAVIVQRASGKSLREFAAERMFDPLGMTNSHFHDEYTHPIRGRAMSYYPGDDGELDVFLSTFDRVGSGGVYSNINDLLKWDHNFYDRKVGGQQVHDWMHQQGSLNNGTQLNYAWGLSIGEHRGLRTVKHGGSLGGYRTALLRYPDQQFSVIILANLGTINPTGLAGQVAEIYLEEKMTPLEGTAEVVMVEAEPTIQFEQLESSSADKLSPFSGRYYSYEVDITVSMSVGEKGIMLHHPRKRNERPEFIPVGGDKFLNLDIGEIQFQRDGNDGAPSSFDLDIGRVRGIRFERVSGSP